MTFECAGQGKGQIEILWWRLIREQGRPSGFIQRTRDRQVFCLLELRQSPFGAATE